MGENVAGLVAYFEANFPILSVAASVAVVLAVRLLAKAAEGRIVVVGVTDGR
jgi:hypothetical protein